MLRLAAAFLCLPLAASAAGHFERPVEPGSAAAPTASVGLAAVPQLPASAPQADAAGQTEAAAASAGVPVAAAVQAASAAGVLDQAAADLNSKGFAILPKGAFADPELQAKLQALADALLAERRDKQIVRGAEQRPEIVALTAAIESWLRRALPKERLREDRGVEVRVVDGGEAGNNHPHYDGNVLTVIHVIEGAGTVIMDGQTLLQSEAGETAIVSGEGRQEERGIPATPHWAPQGPQHRRVIVMLMF